METRADTHTPPKGHPSTGAPPSTTEHHPAQKNRDPERGAGLASDDPCLSDS